MWDLDHWVKIGFRSRDCLASDDPLVVQAFSSVSHESRVTSPVITITAIIQLDLTYGLESMSETRYGGGNPGSHQQNHTFAI